MNLELIKTALNGKRNAYQNEEGTLYIDCLQCNEKVHVDDFGNLKNGFFNKRGTCNPCRRKAGTEKRKKKKEELSKMVEHVTFNDVLFLIKAKSTRGGRLFLQGVATGELYLQCTQCKDVLTFDNFHDCVIGFQGKHSFCRDCSNDASNRVYNAEERKKRYRKNKELENAQHLEWLEKNREYTRDYAKYQYYKNHEEKKKASNQWKKDNWNHILEYKRKYYEENKELHFTWLNNRKARKEALPNSLTKDELTTILNKYNYGCCLTDDVDIHLDHVLPLASGYGGTTYENILPLSAKLNTSKQARNVFEWAEEKHEELGFTMETFYTVISELAQRNNMSLDTYVEYYNKCYYATVSNT